MAGRWIIWTFGWTFVRLGGRTLLSVVWTYRGGPPDVRSVNHIGGHTGGTIGHMLLFEYPLDNT
jgi:hypothetical protein